MNTQCVVYVAEFFFFFSKWYYIFKICVSRRNILGKENNRNFEKLGDGVKTKFSRSFLVNWEVYMARGMNEIFQLPVSIRSLKIHLFLIVE